MDFDDEPREGSVPDFLRDPLGIPARRWPWMLLGLALGLAATAVMVLNTVPSYSARASIMVSSQLIPEDFVRTTIRSDPLSQINALAAGQVFTRSKLAKLVEQYDLYPELRSKLSMDELVGMLRSKIEISSDRPLGARGRETSIVYNIYFTSLDPVVAAKIANSVAALFLEAGVKDRMERASGIAAFLRRHLVKAEVELNERNREISDFKESYRGELPSELNANLSRLERLESQRESAARELMDAQSRLALLSATDADDPTPEGRLLRLRARLEQELALNTPEHPNVASLQRQIAALESAIEGGENTLAASNTSRRFLLEAAQQTIVSLKADIQRYTEQARELDERVKNTGKRQEVVDAMAQRATVARQTYLEFLGKVEDAELAQTLESQQYGAQITLMDPAQPPTAPDQSRFNLMLLGIVGSLGLSLAVGLLLEFLNPLIIDAKQIEALAGLPVLGSVPRIS